MVVVSGAGSAWRERSKALPAFAFFAVLGACAAWLALSSLVPSLRAIVNHAKLVALSPRDAIGLPLALLCFALAGMTLLPKPDTGKRRSRKRPQPRGIDWPSVCLGAAIAGVLLTVVTTPVVEIAAMLVMADRHYTACPAAQAYERHAPLRWVSQSGTCP